MKIIIMLLLINMVHQDASNVLADFKQQDSTSNWYVVDDRVMGGRSQGGMIRNDAGHGVFKGYVTTENNGGFSSVRQELSKKEVSAFEKVILKIKGDGKSYQFRIKTDRTQRYSYIISFETSGDWETITLPFDNFYPSYRGYTLEKPNYPGETMEEIALLIGNKRNENFSLEIEKIYLE